MLGRTGLLAVAFLLWTQAQATESIGAAARANLCGIGLPSVTPAAAALPAARRPVEPFPAINQAVRDLATVVSASALQAVRIEARERYVPDQGPVELLVFYPATVTTSSVQSTATTPINYRVLVVGSSADGSTSQPAKEDAGFEPMLIGPSRVWSEAATPGPAGTDWKYKESNDAKTILHFTTDSESVVPWWWRGARLYVIACGGPLGTDALYYGMVPTEVSSGNLAFWGSLCASLVLYVAAALGTYARRQVQNKRRGNVMGEGTHHAGWVAHLNPVVLTAGSDGRGSATKLQVLFFSLIVFAVMAYIWMRTGRLSGLSTNVLLLMGISGVGAAASAGTDVARNRLRFDNWAWLIERGWLPRGGVGEVHRAKWRDIVTTEGEFDVYRFQMVAFTILVGLSLLQAGAKLNDLSAFDVPEVFLGILGLSQAVYVVGKLVAPPNITELDAQIAKLQAQEKTLRDATEAASMSFDPKADILLEEDEGIRKARIAFSDYLATWKTTSIMFSETLGREVPEKAEERRPPFFVPSAFQYEQRVLDAARVGQPYSYKLTAAGGTAPYTWTLLSRQLPQWLSFDAANGVLQGTPGTGSEGRQEIQIEVTDAAKKSTRGRFVIDVQP